MHPQPERKPIAVKRASAHQREAELRESIDDLAHDITNALTGIEACTRLGLSSSGVAEDPVELLREIQLAARRGLKLVRRLSELGTKDVAQV